MDGHFIPRHKAVVRLRDETNVDCAALIKQEPNANKQGADLLLVEEGLAVRFEVVRNGKQELRETFIANENIKCINYLQADSPFASLWPRSQAAPAPKTKFVTPKV